MKKISINKKDFQPLYNIACSGWKTKFDTFLKDYIFSDTIDFDESFILEMKKACTSDQLPVFNKIFKNYLPKSKFDEITDYDSFCKVSGYHKWELEDFKEHTNPKKALALEQLAQIEEYFGKDWKKNWKNKSQYKYFPVFDITDKGSLVFRSAHSRYYCFGGEVAFFPDEETATFVGKTFISIYEDLL